MAGSAPGAACENANKRRNLRYFLSALRRSGGDGAEYRVTVVGRVPPELAELEAAFLAAARDY